MMSSTMTGEQCGNETKSWCVVWFTESREYSVIPTNWIVKNNESQSDSLFCKWPPYKVTSDHLKKAITPSQSWETYRVKFVGVNKTYDNFNKAWHKKVKEKYSSTDTNDDSSNNKRKRLLMCPSDDTDDDDNDDDNGINFNILPCKQVVSTPSVALEPINYGASTSSIISQFYAENNVIVEETKQYTEMQPKTVQQLEYPQNHSFAEDTSCFIPVSHDSPLNFNENCRLFKIIVENMTGRQIRRLLYGLLILALFVIVIHSGRTAYWLAKDGHYSGQPHTTTEDQPDYNEQQNLQYLESPIQSLQTYSPLMMEPNEISKSLLPWYFKDGLLRPSRAKKNMKTGQRTTQVWPKEQKNGDRVENQLMFIPPNYRYDDEPKKKILLFNGLSSWMVDDGQNVFISKQCPVNRCTITTKKSEAPDVDAILFRDHFSHPGHRKTGKQVWILYFLESPYHTELITYNDVFNWTATYRHDSDIVTPYERWAYYDPSVTQVERLERNYAFNKTKQVAWFVSNCGAKNGRLQYARELAKYISVDVYGVCGQFKCPRSDKCFQLLDQDYKFYLAFENSNCLDYVTEKFFVNGLQHNVLPVVMGGRRDDYERIAPKRSYVHVDDYESPKRLAEYLLRLDADDDLYNEYFRWKGTGEFIDTKFFCRLCAMLHDDGAPAKHYRNVNDWWRGQGVCNNAMPWRRFIESSVDAGESAGQKPAVSGD